MAKLRLQKSLADYVAIAICPVLIMLLVGSLVFFLLAVFYTGRFEPRLHWIMFWFVFASVLIGRIAIEQGSELAGVYGLLLAVATAFVIFRYVDAPVVALILLGVIWWCTNKLTWDSTLIDDNEDASGAGLLQTSGIDEQIVADTPADASRKPASMTATDDAPDTERSVCWMVLLGMHVKQEGKPHAPGQWVVYFSIAALPLFGVGQLGLDERVRSYGFRLLWVYVASALGLLLLTSFLGLRRYLRQRKLTMPMGMAATWIGMGATLILAILLFCVLLPRPESDTSINDWIDKLSSLAQEASDYAVLSDDAGEGEGQRTGKGEDDGEDQDDQNADSSSKSKASKKGKGQGAGENKDSDNDKGEGDEKGEKQRDGKDKEDGSGKGKKQGSGAGEADDSRKDKDQGSGKAKKEGGSAKGKKKSPAKGGSRKPEKKKHAAQADKKQAKTKRQQPTSSAPNASSSNDWVAILVKLIIWGIIALVFLYFLIRHWSQLLEAIKGLWNSLFGRKPSETLNESEADKPPPPRPFASFKNPFMSGAAKRKSPAELVRYSFDALQAWAEEQGCPRKVEQTPLEFGQELRAQFAQMATEIQQLTQLYSYIAYADQSPGRECLSTLQHLWQKMATIRQPSVSQSAVV